MYKRQIVVRSLDPRSNEGSCNGCHGTAVRALEFGSRVPTALLNPERLFSIQATQLRFCAECFAEVRRQMSLHRPAGEDR